jgi:hypothetical protein
MAIRRSVRLIQHLREIVLHGSKHLVAIGREPAFLCHDLNGRITSELPKVASSEDQRQLTSTATRALEGD